MTCTHVRTSGCTCTCTPQGLSRFPGIWVSDTVTQLHMTNTFDSIHHFVNIPIDLNTMYHLRMEVNMSVSEDTFTTTLYLNGTQVAQLSTQNFQVSTILALEPQPICHVM